MSYLSAVSAKTKTLVANGTITGAASNGGSPARVRITNVAHGLETGDIVLITGVVGTVEANGKWVVTKISSSTYDILALFQTAYSSGGTAVHIGWATPAVLVDNTVFSSVPDFTLHTVIHEANSGTNVRVDWEDTAVTDFSDAQPLDFFCVAGPISASGPTYSGEKQHTLKKADSPDARIAASGDNVRARFYLSGGVGASAQFSAYLEY